MLSFCLCDNLLSLSSLFKNTLNILKVDNCYHAVNVFRMTLSSVYSITIYKRLVNVTIQLMGKGSERRKSECRKSECRKSER
jgi:hypothetical protein